MNVSELLHIRLYNQLLAGCGFKEPHEIVSWMGAMQSQSLDLAKWAIGVRLEDKTVKDMNEALNTGKLSALISYVQPGTLCRQRIFITVRL